MAFYDRTDELLDALDIYLIDRFDELKALVPVTVDTRKLFTKIRKLYEELYEMARKYFTELAVEVYKDHKGKTDPPDEDWIIEMLDEVDPVSKYVFANELDRRAAKLMEALSVEGSGRTPDEEIEAAKKSMALTYHIYAVRVTDEAAVKAMIASGVKKVKWIAEDDIHTCPVCHKMDNKIYPVDKIPPKPHINCRCWLRRVP